MDDERTRPGFHRPTEQEVAFLRIVTHGYPELRTQVESCEISEYDATGYCDIHVLDGPPSPIADKCDGPSLVTHDPEPRVVETILWMDKNGLLDTVEVVEYPEFLGNIYERYIVAARESNLTYGHES